MADDVRELILARLVTVLTGITGVATVVRNAQSIDDFTLPAICVWDGDEIAYPGDEPTAGQPPTRFVRMTMMPQIILKIADRPETVGSDLNALRLQVIKAVQQDAELLRLVSKAGHIHPLGCSTQLAYGRTMIGEMNVATAFTYNLRPGDL